MATSIFFKGWFQCRLATDPDDYREPRGNSGWTFAVPGEPDLDRVIRFQAPVAPRSRAPASGVYVSQVVVDGQIHVAHPLLNGTVDLVDNAVFEGRNGEIASAANEPVAPCHLVIKGNGIEIDAHDPIDLNDPGEVVRRQPIRFTSNSAEVLNSAGIGDPGAYRKARRTALKADVSVEHDPVRREGLLLRIDALQLGAIARNSLGFQLDYAFDLRGNKTVVDPASSLALGANPSERVWHMEFWMGGWDADALCGYIKGALSIN